MTCPLIKTNYNVHFATPNYFYHVKSLTAKTGDDGSFFSNDPLVRFPTEDFKQKMDAGVLKSDGFYSRNKGKKKHL